MFLCLELLSNIHNNIANILAGRFDNESSEFCNTDCINCH